MRFERVSLAIAAFVITLGTHAHSLEADSGTWSKWTQIVADDVTGSLVRQQVRLWSPSHLSGLDATWRPNIHPGVAADGTANGLGTIEWRLRGSGSHNASAIIGTYSGEVRGGRPHGYGRYWERSGRFFEGFWDNGIMSFALSLRTPDGKIYDGELRGGLPHGAGREIIDATSYIGNFAFGLREGFGVATGPGRTRVAGLWRGGVLAQEQEPQAPPTQLAQAESRSASMTVYVDRALNQKDEEQSGQAGSPGIVLYEQDSSDGTIKLAPALFPSVPNFDLLARWTSTSRVTTLSPESAYGSANIILDIKNNSTEQLQVVDGYLDVADSMTDRRPFLALSHDFEEVCTSEIKMTPGFSILNSGWGRLQNTSVQYKFTAADGSGAVESKPFTANVGTFLDSADVAVVDGLRSYGVDIKRLQALNPTCNSVAAVPQCLATLFRQGLLGRLPRQSVRGSESDFSSFGVVVIVADITGDILYSWTDAKGTSQDAKSPFVATIPLLKLRVRQKSMAECGGGGPADPNHPKVKLKLDETNYRLPIEYRTILEAGQNKRLGLSLFSDKSSQHSFRAVLRLSDGSIVRSAPIELRYFKAREKGAAP